MTIGQLVRRGGVPVKRPRASEDAGRIDTAGRRRAGYTSATVKAARRRAKPGVASG